MQLLRRQVLALLYLDVVLKLQTEHTGQSGIDQIDLYVLYASQALWSCKNINKIQMIFFNP